MINWVSDGDIVYDNQMGIANDEEPAIAIDDRGTVIYKAN